MSTLTSANSKPQTENCQPKTPATPTLQTYLPLSHLTLLLGDPGSAKSLLASHLAASLSTARSPFPNNLAPNPSQSPAPLPLAASRTAPPENPSPPQTPPPSENCKLNTANSPATSLYLSGEDSLSTLTARLTAMHADLSHIDLFSLLDPREKFHVRSINYDADLIARRVAALAHIAPFRLLVIDPITSFLPHVDPRRSASLREAFLPLLQIAHRANFSILAITHLNKSTRNPSVLHRALDSLALPALARSVLLMTAPQIQPPSLVALPDPSPAPHILTSVKSNLSSPPPPLAFTITSAPALQFVPAPSASLLPLSRQIEQSAVEEALDLLTSSLAAGPLSSKLLRKIAYDATVSLRTLQRAKTLLRIKAFRPPGSLHWHWRLPDDQRPPQEAPPLSPPPVSCPITQGSQPLHTLGALDGNLGALAPATSHPSGDTPYSTNPHTP